MKKSYGMPSSHSSAICFLNTYLQCLFNAALTWQNVIVLVFFHGFALAVVWSRVRLGHHTKSQVIAGSFFGFSCALVAFYCWDSYFSTLDLDGCVDEAFSYVLNLRTRQNSPLLLHTPFQIVFHSAESSTTHCKTIFHLPSIFLYSPLVFIDFIPFCKIKTNL